MVTQLVLPPKLAIFCYFQHRAAPRSRKQLFPGACWSLVLEVERTGIQVMLCPHFPLQPQTHLKKLGTPTWYWIVTTTMFSEAAIVVPSVTETILETNEPLWIHTIIWGNQDMPHEFYPTHTLLCIDYYFNSASYPHTPKSSRTQST